MWQIKKSVYVYKSRWLTVRKDAVRTEKGVVIDDFYVLEYPTWVNVVAITDEGKYIIERQYRHGISQEVYEICAGVCEKDEEPIEAAKRELLEETGFGGGRWSLIGKYAPNPNSMNNWCYSFLAENVVQLKEQQQEPTENITIKVTTADELMHMMTTGQIAEGIMLAPLWHYFIKIKNKNKRYY